MKFLFFKQKVLYTRNHQHKKSSQNSVFTRNLRNSKHHEKLLWAADCNPQIRFFSLIPKTCTLIIVRGFLSLSVASRKLARDHNINEASMRRFGEERPEPKEPFHVPILTPKQGEKRQKWEESWELFDVWKQRKSTCAFQRKELYCGRVPHWGE